MSQLKKLGVITKFLHGDKNQRIEKLVCMVAFHLFIENNFVRHTHYYKYAQYLLDSIKSIIFKTDWCIRLYIDDSLTSSKNKERDIWESVLELLKKYDSSRVQLVHVTFPQFYDEVHHCHNGLLATIFRYLVLFDRNIDSVIFRDIDNIWTDHDFYFSNDWILSGCDGVMYLDNNYRKQEIKLLTKHDAIRKGDKYLTIFAGVWGYRLRYKPLSCTMWHKLLFYTLDGMNFVYNKEFKESKFFCIPFIYGFEELAISRIIIPELITNGKRFYTVPIKIWNIDHFKRLFNNQLETFYEDIGLSKTIRDKVEHCIIHEYWDMVSSTSGRAQLLLGILTNIYYKIITHQSTRFTDKQLINTLTNIYPQPFLMSIGMFVFKHFIKYQWDNQDNDAINKVITDPTFKINWEKYF